MVFVSRLPKPPLDSFVASIWFFESEPRAHALERVLPNGTVQLIVNLKEDQTRLYRPEKPGAIVTAPGTVLSGIRSRYSILDSEEQERVLGVVFRPGGMLPFFGPPAHEFQDTDVPLDVLWGHPCISELREQLLEAPSPRAKLDRMECMLAHFLGPNHAHPAVAYAVETFAHRPDQRIADVTDRVSLSPKRFIERFKAAVGVSPKHYCRILRFQRALANADTGKPVDWTRIAMDSGYSDQPHFNHEFRSFAGITPTEYQAARTRFRNHVKFIQSS